VANVDVLKLQYYGDHKLPVHGSVGQSVLSVLEILHRCVLLYYCNKNG